MMHTFALDPTVGLNQRTPSASSMTTATASRRESNASSIGAGRPILTSSDQGSGGSVHSRSTGLGGDVEMASSSAGLNLTYPPLGHDDEGSSRPPSTLQRAPSIPSALRMTPNSSRRSSFARPAMQQMDDETNLPPPYPSSHPFARGHSGPAADVLPNHSLNPFQPEVFGQVAAGAVGLQSFQGQLGQQEHQADSHQAAAATLNHLWSQLATGRSNCPPTGNIDLPGSSVPGEVDSFATLGTQQLQQLVGATPASSSDASSPDHGFSPAAISNIASFSFAQRVTGHLVQQQATPAVTNPSGGSGTPLGPHRRSSNSDGMSIHGAVRLQTLCSLLLSEALKLTCLLLNDSHIVGHHSRNSRQPYRPALARRLSSADVRLTALLNLEIIPSADTALFFHQDPPLHSAAVNR